MTESATRLSMSVWLCPHCGQLVENPDFRRRQPDRLQFAVERAKELANAFGYALAEVVGSKRNVPLVKVRATIAHELRGKGLSLKDIGYVLGNRHHTTVMHMLRTHPST